MMHHISVELKLLLGQRPFAPMLATAFSHLGLSALSALWGPAYFMGLCLAFFLGLMSGILQKWVIGRGLKGDSSTIASCPPQEPAILQDQPATAAGQLQQRSGLTITAQPLVHEPEDSSEDEEEEPWHVDTPDLHSLVDRFHTTGQETGWKHMMERSEPGVYTYKAYRRSLPNGLTEYKSITTCCNTTPRELMEFLLDDSARASWEAFVSCADVLEQRDWRGSREQVVRLVRKFPFNFLSDREYIIARKVWGRSPGGQIVPLDQAHHEGHMYAITKGMDEHPAAPSGTGLVRTTRLASSWMCSWADDPWAPGGRAAQVTLLHCEDIRIPEYLARTAVSIGMAKFIKDMISGLAKFKQDRYARGMHPDAWDPKAFGHNWASTDDLTALQAAAGDGDRQGVASLAGLRFKASHMSRSGPGTASSPAICSLAGSSAVCSPVSSPTVSLGHRSSCNGGRFHPEESCMEADEARPDTGSRPAPGPALPRHQPKVKHAKAGQLAKKMVAGLLMGAVTLGLARSASGRRGRRSKRAVAQEP